MEWESPEDNFQFKSRGKNYAQFGPIGVPKTSSPFEIFSLFFHQSQINLLAHELTRLALPIGDSILNVDNNLVYGFKKYKIRIIQSNAKNQVQVFFSNDSILTFQFSSGTFS